jgi:glycosyltransferase involved in cell wall biosynthesis
MTAPSHVRARAFPELGRPLRVAMIGLRAPGAEGGVESVVAELGPRLVERGCEVTVTCRPRYNAHGARWKGLTLVDVPTVYTKHLEAIVHTALSMRVVVEGGFDLVHVHAIGNALLSFVPRNVGIPTVVTVHALDWRREKWGRVARASLRAGAWAAGRWPDAVIAVSEETASWFAGSRAPVVRIPNGVTEPPHARLADAGVDGLTPGFALYLGRIVPEKNLETLIRAFARARHPNELLITGGHGHAPEYLSHIARLAADIAPGRVRFTGSRFDRAKAALLRHAGVVAFPSHLEGLPLAMLEAMSCARTVLGSDIPPHRELLHDGCGVLLPMNDVDAWGTALHASSAGQFAGYGARAAARAADRYGWDPITERTIEVYRNVLAARSGRLRSAPGPR